MIVLCSGCAKARSADSIETMTIPSIKRQTPLRKTPLNMWLRPAPSAMRTPISWICRDTAYEMTLYTPIATKVKPAVAKRLSTIKLNRGCALSERRT